MNRNLRLYTHLHLVIAGFTQRRSAAGNGLIDLFDQIYQRHAGAKTLVWYSPWYAAPRDVARRIAELNELCLAAYGEPLTIQIVGYSFGVMTAANVCRELEDVGAYPPTLIDRVVCCDGVARCGRLGWLRAANPFATIRFPGNVSSLVWFRQTHRRWRLQPPFFWPAGHRIDCHPDTDVLGPLDLDAEHTTIDNHQEFHAIALEEAGALHEEHADILAFCLPRDPIWSRPA